MKTKFKLKLYIRLVKKLLKLTKWFEDNTDIQLSIDDITRTPGVHIIRNSQEVMSLLNMRATKLELHSIYKYKFSFIYNDLFFYFLSEVKK